MSIQQNIIVHSMDPTLLSNHTLIQSFISGEEDEPKLPSLIGVMLAVIGSSLIGLSYTASKHAHNKNQPNLNPSPSQPLLHPNQQPEHILVSPLSQRLSFASSLYVVVNEMEEYSIMNTMKHVEWWISILLLLLGEVCNFISYGFAPTSVIAPLGTLSIISGSLSGYLYLNEKIHLRNLLGMILSILGASLIVSTSKTQEPILSPPALLLLLSQPIFLIYLISTFLLLLLLLGLERLKVKGKRLGEQWLILRVMMTALCSGYTVLCTKALSSMISVSIGEMFQYWITYVLILALIINALMTLYMTNLALSAFDATKVLPAEFAAFTLSAVLGSAILYRDFEYATVLEICLFALGCLIIFTGVYFITTVHPSSSEEDAGQRAESGTDEERPALFQSSRPRAKSHQYFKNSTNDIMRWKRHQHAYSHSFLPSISSTPNTPTTPIHPLKKSPSSQSLSDIHQQSLLDKEEGFVHFGEFKDSHSAFQRILEFLFPRKEEQLQNEDQGYLTFPRKHSTYYSQYEPLESSSALPPEIIVQEPSSTSSSNHFEDEEKFMTEILEEGPPEYETPTLTAEPETGEIKKEKKKRKRLKMKKLLKWGSKQPLQQPQPTLDK